MIFQVIGFFTLLGVEAASSAADMPNTLCAYTSVLSKPTTGAHWRDLSLIEIAIEGS